uniref:SAM-dependent MTase RsmB/NOP-type domain-containing protein n=1 Tax=Kalanchoe fedtschenkoi TaxID=63787 RepID=A0A7N0TTI2_KALFE
MGGRGRGNNRARTQRKHFKQSRENVWRDDRKSDGRNGSDASGETANKSWEPFETQNSAFSEYYKEQGTVAPDEWDTFMEVLHKPLPAAFRVNSSSPFCEDLRSQLENDFMKSLEFEDTGDDEKNAIRPLPWYPENLAWHANYSRMQLRKNKSLERFHEFLKQENEIGNITRQEAVSMVPPLFLDVRPDHFVLDMCAAPGSKTFQLLEIIYKSSCSGTLPTGMVVANDVDIQRSNLLIHQTKRMCTANLIVTNHEAQHFPGCRLSKKRLNSSGAKAPEDLNLSQLMFDRILCDVPCSGDGTLRKAPDIWRKWNFGMGNGFHGLQIKIAMRGLCLLKEGSRMVYSTCSMNPVEDEAVVAEILRRCEGSVELLDVKNELPELVRRPGLKKWKVCDKGMWFESYKDVPKSRRGSIIPSMFPTGRNFADPNEDDGNADLEVVENDAKKQRIDEDTANTVADEEVSDLPLDRCIRIVPHDQNSGAFFIAVLYKTSPLPATAIQEKQNNRGCNSAQAEDGSEGDLAVEANIDVLDAIPDDDAVETCADAVADVSAPDDARNGNEVTAASEATGNEEGAKPQEKKKLQLQGKWKGIDPVVFFQDEVTLNKIKDFYGIDESFPFSGHLVTRNFDMNHVKRIYYISKSVKDALELNFAVGQQLKIASVGLKMFERQSSKEGNASPCSFRISSEGLPLLLPHVTKQILYASKADFKHLLQYKSVKFSDFVDSGFGELASKLLMGCCVIVLKTGMRFTGLRLSPTHPAAIF